MKALPMTKSGTVSNAGRPAAHKHRRKANAGKRPAPSAADPAFLPVPPPGPRTKAAITDATARVDGRRRRVAVTAKLKEGGTLIVDPSHDDRLGWQNQLLDAFGTPSDDFTNFALQALGNALAPRGGKEVDAVRLNAGLAIVDGIRPTNETEALLAVQMAAAHTLAMECMERTRRAEMLQQFEANGNMATKFLRTFAVQMETLARVRRGGKQKVIVEHVHVYPGGKAAVGTFVQQQPGGGGGEFEIEGQAHAITGPDALALLTGSVRSENPERQPMPDVAGAGKEPLPDARRRTRKRRA
jgi:hypothetical protein